MTKGNSLNPKRSSYYADLMLKVQRLVWPCDGAELARLDWRKGQVKAIETHTHRTSING
jgi:hypothetical protein